MNKKTLVFGASLKPERYSNLVIKKLTEKNIPTVAFGLRSGEVHGIEIKTSLFPFKDIHTVTLYMNAKKQRMYYDYIINLNPKRVIFNPGAENTEFMMMLKEQNIEAEVACNLVLLSTNQY